MNKVPDMTTKNDAPTREEFDRLDRKLDLILENLEERRAHTERLDDLLADASIITKDFSALATRELDNAGVQIGEEMGGELVLKVLRNLRHLSELMDMLENVNDLGKDVGMIFNSAVMDAATQLETLERKGYFRFASALGPVADRVVEHFTEEDLQDLSDNVVNILETVKRVTQPDMMQAVNNAIVIFRNVETQDIPSMSLFRVVRELNSPEAKKGLGFLITFLKNLGAQELITHPTIKN